MNKYETILSIIIIIMGIAILRNEYKINTRKFVCIENYMYMRVENSLLIYPNSIEPMRCEVFGYIEANKKEAK